MRRAGTPDELVAELDAVAPPAFRIEPPHPDLRYRYVVKESQGFILVFNEGADTVSFHVEGAPASAGQWLDPWHGAPRDTENGALALAPFETALFHARL